MPYRRKNAQSKRKTKTRRKGRRYGRTYMPPVSRGIIPNTRLVKMRYVENIQIDASLGLAGDYVFRANDIYDPNYTSLGHQPMGHDEMALLYHNYLVCGSRMSATFTASGSVPGQSSANCGILLKDTATAETSPTTWIERNKSNHRGLTDADGSKSEVTVTKNFSTKKFFGLKNLRGQTTTHGAAFGSSTTDDVYFHVIVAPKDATLDLQPIYVTVIIDYIVLVSKPKILTES